MQKKALTPDEVIELHGTRANGRRSANAATRPNFATHTHTHSLAQSTDSPSSEGSSSRLLSFRKPGGAVHNRALTDSVPVIDVWFLIKN